MSSGSPQENTQHIYDLVVLCAEFGIRKVVVSPGSRCAPLLLGFGHHTIIETISVTDERSAGFIGLGLAQQTRKPVALVCTSGTATLNFAPAITEAFYQNIPLLVLTADRPPELIDQWDGQTIHQDRIYADHIKGQFVYDGKNRQVAKDALEMLVTGVPGPVHINLPIREPFYPESPDAIHFPSLESRSTPDRQVSSEISDQTGDEFRRILDQAEQVMILGGQNELDQKLISLLDQIRMPILGDVISNLHPVKNIIKSTDIIFCADDPNLAPDFLLTFGRSIISKNLKLYLRQHQPQNHWHIGQGLVGDPFQSLTKTIPNHPVSFFTEWIDHDNLFKEDTDFSTTLDYAQQEAMYTLNEFLSRSGFNYFSAVKRIMETLPDDSSLHLGNSMPVRIANLIGIENSTVEVWSNRGTSGIDGVVSTAVGHALASPDKIHTLIVGDLSFFYDRNGLWLNQEFPDNLRIVILNDRGGGIFAMIPGPMNQEELKELFTTPHKRTAESAAREFGLAYAKVDSMRSLEQFLPDFESGIMEIFTEMETNANIYQQLMS